jgi:Ca-activated chloride channel family protein
VKTSNLKSTSITPIVFGIKESTARNLGLIDKKVTMNDLLTLIQNGSLSFSMANPIMTNSGASAYFNILSTLAGNPEVLTLNHLKDEKLRMDLKSFFKGLERTSGDEDFLEESFINGNYDAAVTYESSIISINKKLESKNKEILYLIYPVDGVTFSDSPLVYVNNGNDEKKEIFLEFQSYILDKSGQSKLASLGRRTWYGGVTDNADTSLFKIEWGIDTTKYISSVKYPSKEVIKEALRLYQEELRKPIHVIFCLDYSGSMSGEGISQLREAIKFIFGESAKTSMIQFSKYDKIDIILFDDRLTVVGNTFNGEEGPTYIEYLNKFYPGGSTALYPAVTRALNMLNEDLDPDYNLSVIVMTDGEGNVGTYSDVLNAYRNLKRDIPIYSITFANADESQLKMLADLSNGKVFDGKKDLVNAFKTVRGYN